MHEKSIIKMNENINILQTEKSGRHIGFPLIGMRIIKTAIAVLLALLVCDLLFKRVLLADWKYNALIRSIFAVTSAALSMQDSIKHTISSAVERILGTLVGVFVGLAFLTIDLATGRYTAVFYVLAALGTVFVIYICKAVKYVVISSLSVVVFLSILFARSDAQPYLSAFVRIIETAIGVIIAVVINRTVFPPRRDDDEPSEHYHFSIKLPHIGMRIIKTAIAVLATLIICDLILYRLGELRILVSIFAVTSAALTMQDSIRSSLKSAFERILGTLAGVLVGLLFLAVDMLAGKNIALFYLFAPLGTILVLYICKAVKFVSVSALSVVIFLCILFARDDVAPYTTALVRIIETAIGVFTAVVINRLICPPIKEKTENKDSKCSGTGVAVL